MLHQFSLFHWCPVYPPGPPGPQPAYNCPVLKSGFAVELQKRRDRFSVLCGQMLTSKVTRLDPILSAYVTNAPADESTECGRLAEQYRASYEAWLDEWVRTFLGTTPLLDNGQFGATKACIDLINCSGATSEWLTQCDQAQAALEAIDNNLYAADARLQQWTRATYMLAQQCPAPRPQP